uniref:Uncharacterized protein n=1 Tax=viral metagenome TaxID=1070528 RepID=A0A6C0EV80_9ZZZZ
MSSAKAISAVNKNSKQRNRFIASLEIATTRFSDYTFKENRIWREEREYDGCVYGTPLMMTSKIETGRPTLVIEMNNDRNRIEGIGFLFNRPCDDNYRRIYSNPNTNRYIYQGRYRLDRSAVTGDYYKKVLGTLDLLLFKGAGHSKRSIGITRLPAWLMFNTYDYDFGDVIWEMFEKYVKVDVKSIYAKKK